MLYIGRIIIFIAMVLAATAKKLKVGCQHAHLATSITFLKILVAMYIGCSYMYRYSNINCSDDQSWLPILNIGS